MIDNKISADLSHLIIVPGHAVYTALDYTRPTADASWFLQDFQRGEPTFYLEHIRRGIELAAQDKRALLVFSGGQTRSEAGPRSEGLSYWLLAEHFGWWGQPEKVRERAFAEEYARDSFENLLFGVCRFREVTGRYPHRLTVVGWGFKAERFELHRAALRWPVERFEYITANDPHDLAAAFTGETRHALEPFQRDPYGTQTAAPEPQISLLGDKRAARNPFRRTAPYALSCPEINALLTHRGPELFSGALPWRD